MRTVPKLKLALAALMLTLPSAVAHGAEDVGVAINTLQEEIVQPVMTSHRQSRLIRMGSKVMSIRDSGHFRAARAQYNTAHTAYKDYMAALETENRQEIKAKGKALDQALAVKL